MNAGSETVVTRVARTAGVNVTTSELAFGVSVRLYAASRPNAGSKIDCAPRTFAPKRAGEFAVSRRSIVETYSGLIWMQPVPADALMKLPDELFQTSEYVVETDEVSPRYTP